MGPLLGSEWFLGNGPLQNGLFFSQFVPPFGLKKHDCVKLRKTFKTPYGSTKNPCCLKYVFSRMCVLPKEKCFFPKWALLIFRLFSTICGTLKKNKNKMSQVSPIEGPFEDQERAHLG